MDNERLQLCIRRHRDGDDTAFEEIYEDLKTPVFTIVCRIVRGREQAERLPNAAPYIFCCLFIRSGRVIAVSLTGKSLSLRRY